MKIGKGIKNYLAITLVALVVYFGWQWWHGAASRTLERFVHKESGGKAAGASTSCDTTKKPFKIMFFYMDTCPHCVDFKPVWKEFTGKLNNSSIGKRVCATDVSADNDALLQKYGVRAFPTVILASSNGKKVVPFEGKRNVDALMQFVSQNAAA